MGVDGCHDSATSTSLPSSLSDKSHLALSSENGWTRVSLLSEKLSIDRSNPSTREKGAQKRWRGSGFSSPPPNTFIATLTLRDGVVVSGFLEVGSILSVVSVVFDALCSCHLANETIAFSFYMLTAASLPPRSSPDSYQ